MDSKHLRTFMCVCKHMSFTKAADELYLTQSAVSQQIHALESELGFPLFAREGKKIILLDAGRLFRERAGQILLLYDRSVEEARAANDATRTTLTIGCSFSYTDWWLPQAISSFMLAHPDVDVSFFIEKTINLPSLMQYGAVDAVVCLGPDARDVPDAGFLPIAPSGPIAIMRSDNPLARQKAVTVHDLATQQLIAISSHRNSRRLHSAFRELSQLGVDVSNRLVVDCGEAAVMAVACGLGVFTGLSFEGPCARRLGLVTLPIKNMGNAHVDIGVMYLNDEKLHLAESLVAIAKNTVCRCRAEQGIDLIVSE